LANVLAFAWQSSGAESEGIKVSSQLCAQQLITSPVVSIVNLR